MAKHQSSLLLSTATVDTEPKKKPFGFPSYKTFADVRVISST